MIGVKRVVRHGRDPARVPPSPHSPVPLPSLSVSLVFSFPSIPKQLKISDATQLQNKCVCLIDTEIL